MQEELKRTTVFYKRGVFVQTWARGAMRVFDMKNTIQ